MYAGSQQTTASSQRVEMIVLSESFSSILRMDLKRNQTNQNLKQHSLLRDTMSQSTASTLVQTASCLSLQVLTVPVGSTMWIYHPLKKGKDSINWHFQMGFKMQRTCSCAVASFPDPMFTQWQLKLEESLTLSNGGLEKDLLLTKVFRLNLSLRLRFILTPQQVLEFLKMDKR